MGGSKKEPREKDDPVEKPGKKKPAINPSTPDLSKIPGVQLATDLGITPEKGVQIKLRFGKQAIDPYGIIGTIFELKEGEEPTRIGRPNCVDGAIIASQPISNALVYRNFLRKSVFFDMGLGPLVTGFKDESVVEAKVSILGNYWDQNGDIIDWNKLVNNKALMTNTGTYVLGTAFSDLELAFSESRIASGNAGLSVGVFKVGTEFYNANELTDHCRIALVGVTSISKKFIEAIEAELKPKEPRSVAKTSPKTPVSFSKKSTRGLNKKLMDMLMSQSMPRRTKNLIPTKFVAIKNSQRS